MSTLAQIEANRLNAQHSTGPRSAEGKAVSRFNATKSGIYAKSRILPGEDPAELDALAEAYRIQYNPVGQDETELVDILVQSAWSQRRLARLEDEVLFHLMSDESLPQDHLLGAAFAADAKGAKMLQTIFRRQQAVERTWFKARAELLKLQKERAKENEPTPNRVRSTKLAEDPEAPRKIMTVVPSNLAKQDPVDNPALLL